MYIYSCNSISCVYIHIIYLVPMYTRTRGLHIILLYTCVCEYLHGRCTRACVIYIYYAYWWCMYTRTGTEYWTGHCEFFHENNKFNGRVAAEENDGGKKGYNIMYTRLTSVNTRLEDSGIRGVTERRWDVSAYLCRVCIMRQIVSCGSTLKFGRIRCIIWFGVDCSLC